VILLRGIEPHPDRLLQLFCITSDLVNFILANTPAFTPHASPAGRKHYLAIAEGITISLYRYLLPHTTFKHFYAFMRNYHQKEFPHLPHYSNMLLFQKQLLPFLTRLLGVLIGINRSAFKNKKVRLMFIDGSDLPVCTNKRIFNHKVAKKVAARGKTSKGWFYGFKLHLLCDDRGNLLGVKITPGNVDERTQVKKLVGDITDAILVGDAEYIKKILQEELHKSNNVWFLTGVKKVMKKLMTRENHTLLKARQLVETVIGSLKHRGGMPNTLPRSIPGYQVHFVMTLLAYTVFGSMRAIPMLPP
jgi:hypothetical protein